MSRAEAMSHPPTRRHSDTASHLCLNIENHGHSRIYHPPLHSRRLGESRSAGRSAGRAERLEQKQQTLPVWPEFTIEGCESQAAELSQLWKNYLAPGREADLAKSVSYRNSKGENWSSRKDDILTHVVTHSAYHRGQIAADMRSAELIPASTDFIYSVRRGFVE